jgi:hypothetical protein
MTSLDQMSNRQHRNVARKSPQPQQFTSPSQYSSYPGSNNNSAVFNSQRQQPQSHAPPAPIHHVPYLPHATSSQVPFATVSSTPAPFVAAPSPLKYAPPSLAPHQQQPQQPKVIRRSTGGSDDQPARANQSYSFRMLNKWIEDSEAVKLTSKKDGEAASQEADTIQKSAG